MRVVQLVFVQKQSLEYILRSHCRLGPKLNFVDPTAAAAAAANFLCHFAGSCCFPNILFVSCKFLFLSFSNCLLHRLQ